MTDVKNQSDNCDPLALLDYVEGLLSEERAAALESHASLCSRCKAELEMMKTADDLLKRYSFCLGPDPAEFEARASESTPLRLPPKLLDEYERSHGVKEGLSARFFAAIGVKPFRTLALGAVAAAILVAIMIHPIMQSFHEVFKEIPEPEATTELKETPATKSKEGIKQDLAPGSESERNRGADLRDKSEADAKVEGHIATIPPPPAKPGASPGRQFHTRHDSAPSLGGSYGRTQRAIPPAEVLPQAPAVQAPMPQAEKPAARMLEKRGATKHEMGPILVSVIDEQGNPVDIGPQEPGPMDELTRSYSVVEKAKRYVPNVRFYKLKIWVKKVGGLNDLTAELINPRGETERQFDSVNIETKDLRREVDRIIREIRGEL
jgi:hypothetical protein